MKFHKHKNTEQEGSWNNQDNDLQVQSVMFVKGSCLNEGIQDDTCITR
ncbi:hypothetical protein [Pontibacter harenae]|nr:hypothetical protein [Pontibacter harenae]MCC9166767.1 hypothetical protein [Pontibacter harenae]